MILFLLLIRIDYLSTVSCLETAITERSTTTTADTIESRYKNEPNEVWCGNIKTAESCEKCGKGTLECAGNCIWAPSNIEDETERNIFHNIMIPRYNKLEYKCTFKRIKCEDISNGNHMLVATCNDCTYLGSNFCTDSLCTWIPSTSLCRPKLINDSTRTATVAILYDLHPPPQSQKYDLFKSAASSTSTSKTTSSTFSLSSTKTSTTTTSHTLDDEETEQPAWFFQKLVITNAAQSTFYGMNGHRYGYAGIQIFDERMKENLNQQKQKHHYDYRDVYSNYIKHDTWDGRILFSIWDPDVILNKYNLEQIASHQVRLVACGDIVTCESNAQLYKDHLQTYDKKDVQRMFHSYNDTYDNTNTTNQSKKENPLHLSEHDAKWTGFTATIENIPIFANEPYYFMTQANIEIEQLDDDDDENTVDEDCEDFDCINNEVQWIEYSGYISSKATFGDSKWRFLATIQVRLDLFPFNHTSSSSSSSSSSSTSQYTSKSQSTSQQVDKRNWWHHGLYSFIEQWEAKSSTHERSALFGPAFISGVTFQSEKAQSFQQISSAEYVFDTIINHETVNAYQGSLVFSEDIDAMDDEDSLIKFASVGLTTGGNAEEDITWDNMEYLSWEEENRGNILQLDEDGEDDGNDENDEEIEEENEHEEEKQTEAMEEQDEENKDPFNKEMDKENIFENEEINEEDSNSEYDVKIRGKRRMNAWTRFYFPIANKPDELVDFAGFIPCLNSAQTTKEIEFCLEETDL